MDLAGSVQITALYPVDSRDETVVAGDAVDISALEGDLITLLDVEAGTGTNPTLNLAIQHREDANDTWAAIPAAALYDPTTGEAATFDEVTDAANSTQKLALRRERLKKTIRAVLTIAGDANPDFVCAVYLVGQPKYGYGW
jgi:hypothetical protein